MITLQCPTDLLSSMELWHGWDGSCWRSSMMRVSSNINGHLTKDKAHFSVNLTTWTMCRHLFTLEISDRIRIDAYHSAASLRLSRVLYECAAAAAAGIREASDTSLLMYDTDFLPKFAPGLLLRTELYRQGTRKRLDIKGLACRCCASFQRLQTTLMLQTIFASIYVGKG